MRRAVPPFSHGVVLGEDRLLLAEGLAPLLATLRRTKDGRYRFGGVLSGPGGAAVMRALMRVEAERLLVDADALGPDDLAGMRTPGERWSDALTDLVLRLLPEEFVRPQPGEIS